MFLGQQPSLEPHRNLSSNVEMAQGAKQVATAVLDFRTPPRGEDRPEEAFSALLIMRLMLRNPFGSRSMIARIVWYLHRTHRLDEARLKAPFPSEDLDVVVELAKLVQEISGVDLDAYLEAAPIHDVERRCFRRWTKSPADRPAALAARYPPHRQGTLCPSRTPGEHLQSHLPRHRHYRVPAERRRARSRPGHGEPLRPTHDQTL
jgi:hypothetical protein